MPGNVGVPSSKPWAFRSDRGTPISSEPDSRASGPIPPRPVAVHHLAPMRVLEGDGSRTDRRNLTRNRWKNLIRESVEYHGNTRRPATFRTRSTSSRFLGRWPKSRTSATSRLGRTSPSAGPCATGSCSRPGRWHRSRSSGSRSPSRRPHRLLSTRCHPHRSPSTGRRPHRSSSPGRRRQTPQPRKPLRRRWGPCVGSRRRLGFAV